MVDIPIDAPIRQFVRANSGSLCAECARFGEDCRVQRDRKMVNGYVCVYHCQGFTPVGKEGGE